MSNELSMNQDNINKILMEDLDLEVCAKMVQKLLNNDQKDQCIQVHHVILEYLKTEPDLLRKVTIGDDSWIFEYILQTKCLSLQHKSDIP